MNKAIALLIGMLVTTTIANDADDKLNLNVYLTESRPFFIENTDSFGETMFNMVFEEAGVIPTYIYQNSIMSLNNAVSDKDGILLIGGWSKQRDLEFKRSAAIYRNEFVLVQRISNIAKPQSTVSIGDLRGLRIGVVKGETYTASFDASRSELDISAYIDDTILAINLYTDRVDAIIISKQSWEYLKIHTLNSIATELDVVGYLGWEYYYALFNKNIPNVDTIIEKFNREFFVLSEKLDYDVNKPLTLDAIFNASEEGSITF